MRITTILIITIFNIPCIFSQDTKKLSKKDANEEVKRLTILIENLELEKNELNNKLMIEYEKLLSEMDQNSNLRIQNGEFRDEIRTMQEQLIEIKRSFSEKKLEIEALKTKMENYFIKKTIDSLAIDSLKLSNQNYLKKLSSQSLLIDSLILSNQNLNIKSDLRFKSETFIEETIEGFLECHELNWYCYHLLCPEDDSKECLKFDNGEYRGNSYVAIPEMKEGEKFKILYTIENIEYYDPYELEVNNKKVSITEKIPYLIYIKKL